MITNTMLCETLFEISKDYKDILHYRDIMDCQVRTPIVLPFTKTVVKYKCEEHFGYAPFYVHDSKGNKILERFDHGDGYGLTFEMFVFQSDYDIDKNLREALLNILFFDENHREEFLYLPNSIFRTSSSAELKELILFYSDFREEITDFWRKPAIDQNILDDIPVAYIKIDDLWDNEWFCAISNQTIFLVNHYYCD